MPLHLIFQCCKCKSSLSHDLWSIARNHKYADSKYVCPHFDVIIDHISLCFLFVWRNEITIKAYCKVTYDTKTVIDRFFDRNFMEYQNYERFGNIVCHARISDYKGIYPTCGFNLQNEIEYYERMEQQRRKERERRRQVERNRQLLLDSTIEGGNDDSLR